MLSTHRLTEESQMLQAPYCPSVQGNHIPKGCKLKALPGSKLQKGVLGYPESWKRLEEPGES